MDKTESYLRDVIALLIDRATEAKSQRDAARREGDSERATVESGRSVAYYEVVSAVLGRLTAYGLDAVLLGVPPNFNADREMV